MKLLYPLLLLALLFSSCKAVTLDAVPAKEQLMLKLSDTPEIQEFIKTYPHAYIGIEAYCDQEDCKAYFDQIGIDIPIYSKEESFMRALKHTIIIQEVNTLSSLPYLRYKLRVNNKVTGTGIITL